MLGLVLLITFASSVVSSLVGKLASDAVLNEISNYLNAERNLRRLRDCLCRVETSLEGAHEGQLRRIELWVLELTMLCYDVEDIINKISLKISEQRQWNIGLSTVDKWKLRNEIADKLEKLEEIEKNINQVVDRTQQAQAQVTRDRSGWPDDNTQLPEGRLIEKGKIIDKLMSVERNNNAGVCIVGMAGLGKSVVANAILKDEMIRNEFNVIQRASTSDDWNSINVETVSTTTDGSWTSRMGEYSAALLQKIWSGLNMVRQQSSTGGSSNTRRSLLLLDDLRITGIRDWKKLRAALVQKLNHDPTVILVTSRDPTVTKITETTLHYLEALSIDDCQDIIKSKVHGVLHSNDYNTLESKVNNVAQKCGGLPLVADLIGDHLRTEYKSNPANFSDIISRLQQRDLWELDVFLREVFPELGFDKASLPWNLRKFLAYFALFPFGHVFKKNDLSLMWMAEGFIPVATGQMLEPTIDYFDSLVATSMIKGESPSEDNEASLTTYKMHNFAHKVAQIIGRRSLYFCLNEGDNLLPFNNICIRHFSSCCRNLGERTLNDIGERHARLRTFLLLAEHKIDIQYDPLISLLRKLEYLRVLSLERSKLTRIPETISKMKHLRYFDASYTDIETLPTGLCNLLGLQVLKLKHCPKLLFLPKNIVKLTNLILLDLDMPKLHSTPSNLGRLTNLQIQSVFVVDKLKGHGVSELKNLDSLHNSLKITKLENVLNKHQAKKAKLSSKQEITKLELEWIDISKQTPFTAKDVLTQLEPNNMLRELNISNYIGFTIPIWVNKLENVHTISLYNCPNCTKLPPFGLLPLLKTLKVENLCNIEIVQNSPFRRTMQFGEYRKLTRLEIRNMDRLVKWIMLPEDMLHLRELIVAQCPQLVCISVMRNHPFIQPDITDCPRLIAFGV